MESPNWFQCLQVINIYTATTTTTIVLAELDVLYFHFLEYEPLHHITILCITPEELLYIYVLTEEK